MSQRIILSVISLAMLVFSLQKGNKKAMLLTLGLTLAVLAIWMKDPLFVNVGFFLFTAMALVIALFGAPKHDTSLFYKSIIFLIGIWSVVMMLSGLMHWPYYRELMLSILVPLSGYLILLRKGLFHKNEFPYISILSVGLLLDLLSFWRF